MYKATGVTLGEGTFSKVMEVTKDGVLYAKKQFYDHDRGSSVKLFERQVMEMLKPCPYIVSLVDVEENGDLIMTKMDGSLLDLMRLFRCLPEPMLIDMTYHVLSALKFLYRHGLVHCDVKPENVLFFRTPETYSGYQFMLADFGNSRWSTDLDYTPIQTLEYRCVENLLGLTLLDTCCDIMSLGCMLCEAVTGLYVVRAEEDETYKHIVCLLEAVGKKILATCDASELPQLAEYMDGVVTEDGIAPLFPYYYKKYGYKHGSELTDLIQQMLLPFPKQRIHVLDALDHPWFFDESSEDEISEDEMCDEYEFPLECGLIASL